MKRILCIISDSGVVGGDEVGGVTLGDEAGGVALGVALEDEVEGVAGAVEGEDEGIVAGFEVGSLAARRISEESELQ